MHLPVQHDARGTYIMVGLDRADDVREALFQAGVAFREEGDEDCGCGGPVVAVFRLQSLIDELPAAFSRPFG